MSTLDTALALLGSSGLASGIVSIAKGVIDKSDLRKKLKELEETTLPALRSQINATELRVQQAVMNIPDLEQRALAAVLRLEAAIRSAGRASRSTTGAGDGAAAAELTSLRREVDAMKGPVEANKTSSALALQRLDTIERRFEAFETAYRDDYNELLAKVSGITGEFKQAMRGNKNASRPSDG